MTARFDPLEAFTTLERIAAHDAMPNASIVKLRASVGFQRQVNEPILLSEIMEFLGRHETLAVMSADPVFSDLSRHFKAWCAGQVFQNYSLIHPDCPIVRNQLLVLVDDSAPDYLRRSSAYTAVGAGISARARSHSGPRLEFAKNWAASQAAFAAGVSSVLYAADHAIRSAEWAAISQGQYGQAKKAMTARQSEQLALMLGGKR